MTYDNFAKKKKKRIKYYVVGITVSLLVLAGGTFYLITNRKKTTSAGQVNQQKPNSSNPPSVLFPPKSDNNPSNDNNNNSDNPENSPPTKPLKNPFAPEQQQNEKKALAEKIKVDLKNDLGRVKNKEKPLLRYVVSDTNFSIRDEKNSGKSKLFSCAGFCPNLEEEDYQEIVKLINQLNQLKEKNQQEKWNKLAEEDKKKVFVFVAKGRNFSKPNAFYYVFQGEKNENGKELLLFILPNHPDLASIFSGNSDNSADNSKIGDYYFMEGIELLPLEPHHILIFREYPCKYPKLENRFSITPYTIPKN